MKPRLSLRRPPTSSSLGLALALALGGLLASAARATEPLTGAAMAAVESLVQRQALGAPGKVSVTATVQSAASLLPCAQIEAFLPVGAALRGRVSVGLRCRGERPWTRFVQAYVKVEGRYFVTAHAIDAGQLLSSADLVEQTGDLAALPRSIATAASQLQGAHALNAMAAGLPLRRDAVRAATVIQQGQTVQVVAQGAGFTVSTEAKALGQAASGALVRAKTRDGRLISGVADPDGQIVLSQ